MYAQDDLMPWTRAVLAEAGDPALFDAHVHVGLADPAGLLATEEEAVRVLEQVGSRGLVFPLKEPTGYREANRRMIALAEESGGRLRALCRLDPADDPVAELGRCLDRGAVGLKLHPRGEGFALDDPRLDGVFAAADERRLPVMVHAGAGDDAVVPAALDRAARHPGARVVLAHCAVGAFGTAVARARDLPNLYFDTSWWNPSDVWALLRLVPPGRILHASDVPFASPAQTVLQTGRLALEAGLDHEQVRSVLGGQLERLVRHEEPLDPGRVPEVVAPLPPELERLYVTLCTAVEPMLRGADGGQGLDLARSATADPVDGPHASLLASIGELLALAEARTDPDPLRPLRTPGFDLVLAAAVLARTPSAGVPGADPGRRAA